MIKCIVVTVTVTVAASMVAGAAQAQAQERAKVPKVVRELADALGPGGLRPGERIVDGRLLALACPMPVSRPDWQLLRPGERMIDGQRLAPVVAAPGEASIPTMRSGCVNTLDLDVTGPLTTISY